VKNDSPWFKDADICEAIGKEEAVRMGAVRAGYCCSKREYSSSSSLNLSLRRPVLKSSHEGAIALVDAPRGKAVARDGNNPPSLAGLNASLLSQ